MATKILFVTDLHGGNRVFRKSIALCKALRADILLVGGDVCGKFLVPVEGGTDPERQPEEGGYAVPCEGGESAALKVDESFRDQVLQRERSRRLRQWLEDAERELGRDRFLLNLGNDDPFYLDPIVASSLGLPALEYRTVDLPGGFILISCGFANTTPWSCPRDVTEEVLERMLDAKLCNAPDPTRVIANLHCPPAHSTLDRAPRLDKHLRPIIGANGVELVSVGSTAVRRVIERYAPCVALHGHIHEAYGKERIGRTICVNPGSSYRTGELRAALVHLSAGSVQGVQLVRED